MSDSGASTSLDDLAVDGYRIGDRLGGGGMGEVWAATRLHDQRPVALKFVRLSGDAKHLQRFQREVSAVTAIEHPNVVKFYEVATSQRGAPVMVMELLEGESLAERLARESKMPLGVACRTLLSVIAAVSHAHALGIVHRDLKPANIFLAKTEDGGHEVKVLDFGIAKVFLKEDEGSEGGFTTTGDLIGTPLYMAPEQVFGERDLDHRTDVWALGIILYQTLSGILPTQADNVGQILKIVTTRPLWPLADAAPDVPVELASIVDRMLVRERADRLSDLREVAEVLARYADTAIPDGIAPPPLSFAVPPPLVARSDASSTLAVTPARRDSLPRPRSQRRWIAAGALLAFTLGGGGAAYVVVQRRAQPPPVQASEKPPACEWDRCAPLPFEDPTHVDVVEFWKAALPLVRELDPSAELKTCSARIAGGAVDVTQDTHQLGCSFSVGTPTDDYDGIMVSAYKGQLMGKRWKLGFGTLKSLGEPARCDSKAASAAAIESGAPADAWLTIQYMHAATGNAARPFRPVISILGEDPANPFFRQLDMDTCKRIDTEPPCLGQACADIQAPDLAHVDVLDLVPQATKLAESVDPGAKLVKIDATVAAGVIDLTGKDPQLWFSFAGAAEPNSAINVIASSNRLVALKITEAGHREPLPALTCTSKKAWEAAYPEPPPSATVAYRTQEKGPSAGKPVIWMQTGDEPVVVLDAMSCEKRSR